MSQVLTQTNYVGYFATSSELTTTIPVGFEGAWAIVESGNTIYIWNVTNAQWEANAAGSGSVTSVSVVTANGFSGSVANASTTPAITLNNPTTLTINDSTTPTVTTASGKTNTGYFQVNGKTSGALRFTTADATAQTLTVSAAAQTVGAATITYPDVAGVSDTPALTTLAQTLSNKTLASPTISGGTVTLSVDTNFVTSGGVNGFSVDTDTLSVDGTNNRVGIGTIAPESALHVQGTRNNTNPSYGFHAGMNGNDCAIELVTALSSGATYIDFGDGGIDYAGRILYFHSDDSLNFQTNASATHKLTISSAGCVTMPVTPAFLAYLGTTDSNVTGNGTAFTLGSGNALTEVFDQGSNFNTNGTFTAPVTGKYNFSCGVHFVGLTIASAAQIILVTSNRSVYLTVDARAAGSSTWGISGSVLVDMDAGDTATIQLVIVGEAGLTADVFGSGSPYPTWFSGNLEC